MSRMRNALIICSLAGSPAMGQLAITEGECIVSATGGYLRNSFIWGWDCDSVIPFDVPEYLGRTASCDDEYDGPPWLFPTGTSGRAEAYLSCTDPDGGATIEVDFGAEASATLTLCENSSPPPMYFTCTDDSHGNGDVEGIIGLDVEVQVRACYVLSADITINDDDEEVDVFLGVALPGVNWSDSFTSSDSIEIRGRVLASGLGAITVIGTAPAGTAEPGSDSADFAVNLTVSVFECIADWDCNGDVDASDFFGFLDDFEAEHVDADLTGSSDPNSPDYGVPDQSVDAADYFYYLDRFVEGSCAP